MIIKIYKNFFGRAAVHNYFYSSQTNCCSIKQLSWQKDNSTKNNNPWFLKFHGEDQIVSLKWHSIQKQSLGGILSKQFLKTLKSPMSQSFNKFAGQGLTTLLDKKRLAQIFLRKLYKSQINTVFMEHLQTTDSVHS